MQFPSLKNRALRGWLAGFIVAVALALPAEARALGFVISEVVFEANGGNNGNQWIELYNGTGSVIDLGLFSLGWGRTDYTRGTVDLDSALLNPGDTWLIGGPNLPDVPMPPPYDQIENFDKDLRKGNTTTADGIALFEKAVSTTVPYFAVFYGKPGATTVLLDVDGLPADSVDIFTAAKFNKGESLAIGPDGVWAVATSPSPGAVAVPEPGTAVLFGAGLSVISLSRRRLCPSFSLLAA